MIALVEPSLDRLDGYEAALASGWSPNTIRDVSGEQLAAIRTDAGAFLRDLTRQEGGTLTLPDWGEVPRLPGKVLWMWDGAFCGSINFRHVPGTEDLPPYVSGHVGYAVVPAKRGRGYASEALRQMLPVASARGLARILVTCDPDNAASRRVIERCGGVADGTERGGTKLRFWVDTGPAPAWAGPAAPTAISASRT